VGADDVVVTYTYVKETPVPFTVTVNYIDVATRRAIANPYSAEIALDGRYDVSAQDKIAITDYGYVRTEGATSGVAEANVVINVYYRRNVVINPPVVVIDEEEVPLGNDEITILDEDVPLGNLPQSGSVVGETSSMWRLGVLAFACGAALLGLSRKKDEDTEK